MIETLALIIGITGIIAIGLNFLLEATNSLKEDHKAFGWINLYGSTALCIYAIISKAWLFAVLNGLLILIGIYGLTKIYSNTKIKFKIKSD